LFKPRNPIERGEPNLIQTHVKEVSNIQRRRAERKLKPRTRTSFLHVKVGIGWHIG